MYQITFHRWVGGQKEESEQKILCSTWNEAVSTIHEETGISRKYIEFSIKKRKHSTMLSIINNLFIVSDYIEYEHKGQ